MKRIITLGLAIVLMLVSLGGCFIPYYDDGGRGGGHDRGEGHDRGDRHEERR